MATNLSSCGGSKGSEWGVGVFLVHTRAPAGAGCLSFSVCCSDPPFPAAVEGTLSHRCALSGGGVSSAFSTSRVAWPRSQALVPISAMVLVSVLVESGGFWWFCGAFCLVDLEAVVL